MTTNMTLTMARWRTSDISFRVEVHVHENHQLQKRFVESENIFG